MLTQTTEIAIQALLHLALTEEEGPIPLQQIAKRLEVSPSYLVKITGHLTRAGILRSHRGAQGGVSLMIKPEEVSLLAIVEACQGKILGDFCQSGLPLSAACAFHSAMLELHEATVGVLARWSLGDLMKKPFGDTVAGIPHICRMRPVEISL